MGRHSDPVSFITVKSTIEEWSKEMNFLQRQQLPFATSVALNETATACQEAQREAMASDFDRPTPFTLNSTFVKRSTKDNLNAEVRIKDESFKSNAPTQWLEPEISGGLRPLKRFESALRRIGILPSGLYCTPGAGATLDAYGNMDRGEIVKILSWFQAFGEQGYRANSTFASRQRRARGTAAKPGDAYFALLYRRGRLRPGIYARRYKARTVRPIIEFVPHPHYRTRLPFYQINERVASLVFPGAFERALGRALATAR